MNGSNQCDVAFLNGYIMTMSSLNEIVEAVAIHNGKILRTGTNEEIKPLLTKRTNQIDLRGKTMLPGFIDAHTHLDGAALNLAFTVHVHTPPLGSVKEILRKVREEAKSRDKGDVIICQGSFQLEEKVIEKRYPTKAELDRVAPDNPVLIRASAHVYILNSMALKVANISRDTADPRGAQIERDSSGEPTGVLREFHKYLSLKSYTAEEMRTAIKQFAYDYYVKRGVTSVYDLPFSSASIAAYQELLAEKELPLRFRVAVMIPHVTDLDCFLSLGLRPGFGNDQISIGGVKIFLDGDADTAAVYEHFSGPPDFYGLLTYSQEELDEIVMKVHEARMQIMIHAVGDRAQDMALDAIEAAIKKVPRKDHRHRIEHLGDFFCTKERIKRVKELGVIPVVTPAFPYDCGEYYRSRIGPNGPQLCGALRSMLDEGLLPPGSSDCVGSIPNSTNPFFNIWCAVTKETVNGHIVCPEERISILEGIRMYTVNSAYSGFEEKIKGTIEPGKLADLIVLSDNPLSVSEGEIKNIGVVMTVIGGRIVYEE